MISLNSNTRLCCLLGDPIDHSISPQMHNAAFSNAKINFCYLAFKTTKHNLSSAINGIRALNIRGVNITVPHKVKVISHLDRIDEKAVRIKAVNTILNRKGSLIGYNTDGEGAVKAIGKKRVEAKNIVIIGAGGTSRAIISNLQDKCNKIFILNRNAEKSRVLASEIDKDTSTKIVGLSLSRKNMEKSCKECNVLINTTPIGMFPHISDTVIDKKYLKREMIVFDVSMRIPGSPLTRFTPHSGYLYGNSISYGERIAMEIKKAVEQGRLKEIVT